MVRKHSVYQAVLFGWALLVFGSTIAVYSGEAAPLVTPSMLPVSGPIGFLALPVGLVVLGAIVVEQGKARAWRTVGRHVDLSAEGGGLLGKPDLVGVKNGRRVRVRTTERKTGGGESGTNTATFTVVEASLERKADDGLVLGHQSDGNPVDVGSTPVDFETQTKGDVAVVGGTPELRDEVLTSRVESALAKPALNDAVLAGNALADVLEAVPSGGSGITGSLTEGIASSLEEKIPGGADGVRTESKGLLLDSAELAAQLDAVTTVADAFEDATR